MKQTYFKQATNVPGCGAKLIARNIVRGGISFASLSALLLFQACDPTQIKKEDFGTVPTQSQISIQVSPGKDDFRFALTAKSPVSGIAKWDFGNGDTWAGSANIADTAHYVLPGTYKIKLSLYTRAGVIYDSTTVTTTKTDYDFFNSPVYTFLSGGISNATTGKTWVLDSLHWGHMGMGDPGNTWPDWWGANPLDKKGAGIYDDKLVFKLDGLHVDYINNGTTYAQNGVYKDLGGVATAALGDFIVQYTPPTNLTWSIIPRGSKNYLVFTNGGFMMFYTGGPFEYEITAIDENTISLRQQVSWTAWYFKLIREGYTYN